ncbi:hypothetical protein HY78_12320 [Rhizorhabdus wittichii DC-6]|uniref:Uncharacterized protein n=2 Tax=Rhizorhabdus wittichii TaxID=160791 RepID=A0A9J9HCM2_RHIWR|nr:hypothetical protein [Rhizorhabdus wittichii]ABQ68997.1 hypothetical protein Swit_2639 [Rhizorhabdus wittichii RW1]ARR54163.1 hypothetical protein HY78_12320 [Rhizorhabdus wittichii DC-6]QTH20614.1 hypothetical protein HRJ34_20070 [Rhizorhabdus wittichii]
MAYVHEQEAARPGAVETVGALLQAEGAKGHPYIASQIFARGREASRDLADAVHLLSSLHGGGAGVIDQARGRTAAGPVRGWLDAATEGFAAERAYLMRVVVAAGPLPSTPGQARCEAAVAGQRHALDMLGRSDRAGCALGAAVALVLDWRAIRTVIDAAAQRFGVALVPPALPSPRRTMAAVADAVAEAPVDRAMMFGAQQLLIQHRGLWGLLEARAEARNGVGP